MSSRTQPPAKRYNYWIDVSDLIGVCTHTLNLLEKAAEIKQSGGTQIAERFPAQDLAENANEALKNELAADDDQIFQVLSLVDLEAKGKCNLEDILISKNKLIYFIENQKVITDIFIQ